MPVVAFIILGRAGRRVDADAIAQFDVGDIAEGVLDDESALGAVSTATLVTEESNGRAWIAIIYKIIPGVAESRFLALPVSDECVSI